MDIQRRSSWGQGSNNIARPNRLPVTDAGDAAVRAMVNLDVGPDGVPTLRTGYTAVCPGVDVRAAYSVGPYVVLVDGLDVRSYNTRTDEVVTLGALNSTAPVSGAVLNHTLYLSSATDSIRTDGVTLSPWAVPTPGVAVTLVSGSLPAGVYKVAASAVGASGEESGAGVVIIRVPDNSGLLVQTADPRPLRLYVSTANGEALYYQRVMLNSVVVGMVDDSSERLVTDDLTPMVGCDSLCAHHSVLLGHKGNCVFFTSPMYPHLTHPVRGFFQYAGDVVVVAPTDGGVYVVADQTWFLTALETDKPQQRMVLNVGAVAGTHVLLPDGRVAWFTRYGQAVGDTSGTVQLLNQATYAPDTAAVGAAGLVEHDGHQMVVTTMRGVSSPNNLATGDFADLETGNE